MRPVPLLLAVSLTAALGAAEDPRIIPVAALDLPDGPLSPSATEPWSTTVMVEGGDGYVLTDAGGVFRLAFAPSRPAADGWRGVVVTMVDGVPRRTRIRIPAAAYRDAPADVGGAWRTAAVRQFEMGFDGVNRGIAGWRGDRAQRAWWTVRMAEVDPARTPDPLRSRRRGDPADLLDLATGAGAVAGNLALDRAIAADFADASVDIAGIPGVATEPIDWARMPGATAPAPAIDPLAAMIPADQHGAFFPGIGDLLAAADGLDALLAGPLGVLGDHAGDAGAMDRIRRQLGLGMAGLDRTLGPALIEQVAVTGSDPFVRDGSDVAVLLRARPGAPLAALLETRRQALVAAGAADRRGTAHGRPWAAAVSADGRVRMHLLVDGEVVVVATSPVQLDAYAAVRAGLRPSLAGTPDLAFFRRRYPLAAGAQGLAVVSDATLRRWMGPRQVIGQAMREQAAWQLALLQARWIRAGADPAWIPADVPALLGPVAVDRDGVRSERWGRPGSLTPVAELDLDRVSATAARSYEAFRTAYERSWRGVIDPIAVEIRAAPERVVVDLSVLPVRLDRDYREIRRLAGQVRFAAGAPDIHDAVASLSLALDRLGLAREMGGGLRGMLGRNIDPFAWVGEHGTLFADPGPAWDELRAAMRESDRLGRWFEADPGRLPIGLTVAVDQPLALAAFLTALRGMADQSAPGMTEWTNSTHAGLPIVTVRAPGERGIAGNLALHYLAAPEGLTVSLNRGVVERAAERIAARRAGTAAAAALPPAGQLAASASTPWLAGWLGAMPDGQHGGTRDLLLYEGIGVGDLLTEWKLHVPGEDPVAFHERVWGVRPAAMIGGTWRWDPEWMQMVNDRIGNPWSATAAAGAPDWTRRLPRLWAALDTEPVPVSATAARRGDEAIGIRVRIVGERGR